MSGEFNAQDEIKAIVADAIAPLLKECGYRKSGYTWAKAEHELTKVVNVQLSRYNSTHEAKFTINLGIYHEAFHRLRANVPLRGAIKEYDCDARLRIGELMGKNDHWWIVGWDKDNEKVRDGVKYNAEHFAIPWLNGFTGLGDMLNFFRQKSMHFDAAVASHLLGGSDVPELLARCAAKANPHFRPTLERWAKAQGYAIDPAAWRADSHE